MDRVVDALNALRMNDPDRLGDWFGRFITLYRARRRSAAPRRRTPSRIELEWDLGQGARLLRHPWSRLAWRRAGKGATAVRQRRWTSPCRVRDAQRMAAAAGIDGALYASLSQAGRDAVVRVARRRALPDASMDEDE